MSEDRFLPQPLKRGTRIVVIATGVHGVVMLDEDDGMCVVRYDPPAGAVTAKTMTHHVSQLRIDDER